MLPRGVAGGGAMDKTISHILAGVMLSGLGLWHLFNHIRLFFFVVVVSHGPTSSTTYYVAPAWFPAPRVRHLELIVMLAGGAYGFLTQMLAYSPMPFAADGSIPPERLPNHEHAILYASLLVYAGSAIYLDHRARGRQRHTHTTTLCMLLLAALYAQELFVFHVHSTADDDHHHAGGGVEHRLHWFLQATAAACLATALLGAAGRLPTGLQLAVSLVRSASLALQGLWSVLIGVVWIPGMAPKGCSLEDGGVSLRCHGEDSLRHAMAVVNLQFGWCLVLVTLLVLGFYVYVSRKYPAAAGEATTTCTCIYGRLPEAEAAEEEEEDDHHHHNMKTTRSCTCKAAVHDDVHGGFMSMEIEV